MCCLFRIAESIAISRFNRTQRCCGGTEYSTKPMPRKQTQSQTVERHFIFVEAVAIWCFLFSLKWILAAILRMCPTFGAGELNEFKVVH